MVIIQDMEAIQHDEPRIGPSISSIWSHYICPAIRALLGSHQHRPGRAFSYVHFAVHCRTGKFPFGFGGGRLGSAYLGLYRWRNIGLHIQPDRVC